MLSFKEKRLLSSLKHSAGFLIFPLRSRIGQNEGEKGHPFRHRDLLSCAATLREHPVKTVTSLLPCSRATPLKITAMPQSLHPMYWAPSPSLTLPWLPRLLISPQRHGGSLALAVPTPFGITLDQVPALDENSLPWLPMSPPLNKKAPEDLTGQAHTNFLNTTVPGSSLANSPAEPGAKNSPGQHARCPWLHAQAIFGPGKACFL